MSLSRLLLRSLRSSAIHLGRARRARGRHRSVCRWRPGRFLLRRGGRRRGAADASAASASSPLSTPSRRDPSAPRPPPDPNAPRLPDSTVSRCGPRLSLHNQVQSLIRCGESRSGLGVGEACGVLEDPADRVHLYAVMAAMLRAKRVE
ncbi:uncharacterized protein A4U43_C04F27690 [Asparagus officinalis]|uniref:Uncharacterized protein n=1 Tax=Asparagus officinalis TaxID=4686 RepID=A0A5P1F5W2_ASPOF|nr:uncharacterized protein A4U43_C04F27690 [Asparagus officinalis]